MTDDIEAIADWFERNNITNSGAAWLDEHVGLIYNEEGDPLDHLILAREIAMAIKQRAWVQP